MTWISFDNVHGWKLIHVCKFLLFPQVKAVTAAKFGTFYGSVRTKKSMNGVYTTNIGCCFIWGIVQDYYTFGRIQP